MQFWTAASSEGQFCNLKRTFSWCTTGTIIDEAYVNDANIWVEKPTGNESAGNCIALGLSANDISPQLSLAECTESNSFMCQVV